MLAVAADNDTYVPMIRDGRVWVYSGYSQVYHGWALHYMKFDGTQNVNGTEYHRFVQFKTLVRKDGKTVVHRDYSTGPVYYVREEPGKLFVLCKSGLVVNEELTSDQTDVEADYSDLKVYDFTLDDGTTWDYPAHAGAGDPVEVTMPVTVKWLDPVKIDDVQCKVMGFEVFGHYDDRDGIKFIETIGTTSNGVLPIPNFDNISGTWDNTHEASIQSTLYCVLSENGDVIYKCGDSVELPFNDGYAPIIEEGKVWEYAGTYFHPGEDGRVIHYMKFDGTVEVNGHVYHGFGIYNSKFYREILDYEKTERQFELSYEEQRDGPMWFLREEEGKLYGLTYGLTDWDTLVEIKASESNSLLEKEYEYGEFKLYDFTLPENGEMEFAEWGDLNNCVGILHVHYSDNVVIDGTSRLVQQFWPSDDRMKAPGYVDGFNYIEGIGVTYYGCLPSYGPLEYSGMMYDNSYSPWKESWLKSVRKSDGTVIYGDDSPVGIELTKAEYANNESGAIYDLMGRRVERVLPGSVYVRDGKKFVGK